MNPERLRALGVPWTARRAAVLNGWALSFSKRASDATGCAYATILPAAGAQVEGVLYTLVSGASCALLDAFEGPLYRRDVVSVRMIDGRTRRAQVYIARADACADGLQVEAWYLAHLLAASDLLTPSWVARLRAQPVIQSLPRW